MDKSSKYDMIKTVKFDKITKLNFKKLLTNPVLFGSIHQRSKDSRWTEFRNRMVVLSICTVIPAEDGLIWFRLLPLSLRKGFFIYELQVNLNILM